MKDDIGNTVDTVAASSRKLFRGVLPRCECSARHAVVVEDSDLCNARAGRQQ